MMKNNTLIFVIVCFIAVGVVLFFEEKRMSRAIAEKVEIEKNIEYMKNLCSSFTSSINDFVLYDDLDIADCEITDSEGKQQKLSNVIISEKLIIYLPEISCTSCSDGEINILNSFFSENEKGNIVVVANFRSNRELKIFEKNAGIKTYGIAKEEQFPSRTLNGSIVLFLLSDSFKASCLFIPDRTYGKLSEIYYEAVANKFQKQSN
ncbi:hypothetical protein [Viscerimonas tarda]